MSCAPLRRRICRGLTMALRARPIRNPISWATSIAFTAYRAASSRCGIIAAPTALSRTEAGRRTTTMTVKIPVHRDRGLRVAVPLVALALVLGACTHTDEVVTAGVPDDYRLRHPIAIQEADQSVLIFVGRGRGGLSGPQRADVIGLAQVWLREGTG